MSQDTSNGDHAAITGEQMLEHELLAELMTPHISAAVGELSWEYTRLRLLDIANRRRLQAELATSNALREAMQGLAATLDHTDRALRDVTDERDRLAEQVAALQQQLEQDHRDAGMAYLANRPKIIEGEAQAAAIEPKPEPEPIAANGKRR